MPSVIPDWQQTVTHAQAAFKAKVEATGSAVPTVSPTQLNMTSIALEDVLSSEDIAITELSVGKLVAKLAKADLSSEQVTCASCHCAVIAHSLTNCLTDIFFDRAIERAKALDAESAQPGGEGALVGLHGSPIGIGSDIGGSVRIPCAFNGLYGLRSSFERMPYGGSTNSMEGFTVIPSVLGPMSSSLDGVKLFFKAVLDAEPWRLDPLALHMPWSESAYQLAEHGGGQTLLCFGFISHNGIAKPDPPYLRALETMKKALLAKGHKVIDYTPVDAAKGSSILTELFLADGGEDIATQCATSGEPLMEGAFKGVVKPPAISTYAFWQLCRDRRDYIAEQLAAWERTKELTGTGRPVDALISPPAPYPSFRHGDLQDIFYTGICNLCDYPAAVFPVTKVDPAVDVKAEPYEFASDFDKINYERYDAEVYRDAPVALQLIGRKGEDEAVIKMMELAKVVSCYFPWYQQSPVDVPYNLYTHLNYFVFTTTSSPASISQAGISDSVITDFVTRAHAAGITTSYVVGGWTGSQYFSTHVSTATSRATFARTLVSVMQQYNFDGIDIDWEYPGQQGEGNNVVSPNDSANFLLFLQTLRSVAGVNASLSISINVAGMVGADGNTLTDLSSFAAVLDYVTTMSYDITGTWSSFTGSKLPLSAACARPSNPLSIATGISYLQSAGFAANHILVGMPAYSYSYYVQGPLTQQTCPDGTKSSLYQYATVGSTCGTYIGNGPQFLYRDIYNSGYFTSQSGYRRVLDQSSQTWILWNPTTLSFIPCARQFFQRRLAGTNMFVTSGDTSDGRLVRAIRQGFKIDPTTSVPTLRKREIVREHLERRRRFVIPTI
ncbi:hypothetical protein JCM10021v2_002737 [Rhodotorula toruloides]